MSPETRLRVYFRPETNHEVYAASWFPKEFALKQNIPFLLLIYALISWLIWKYFSKPLQLLQVLQTTVIYHWRKWTSFKITMSVWQSLLLMSILYFVMTNTKLWLNYTKLWLKAKCLVFFLIFFKVLWVFSFSTVFFMSLHYKWICTARINLFSNKIASKIW